VPSNAEPNRLRLKEAGGWSAQAARIADEEADASEPLCTYSYDSDLSLVRKNDMVFGSPSPKNIVPPNDLPDIP
jgi:hypothetical protein